HLRVLPLLRPARSTLCPYTTLFRSRFSTTLGMYLGAHVSTTSDLDRAMRNPLKSEDFSYDIKRPNQSVSHDLIAWRTTLLPGQRSEEHTSELQSRENLVCRLLLEKK